MHSLVIRASALLSFAVTALLAMAAAVAVSGPVLEWVRGGPGVPPPPVLAAGRVSVELGRMGYYHDYSTPPHELGKVHFDLDAGGPGCLVCVCCGAHTCHFHSALNMPLHASRSRADLTGLWHWNTKLLFVFVTATFPTPTHVSVLLLLVVVWCASCAHLLWWLQGSSNQQASK